MLPSGHIAAGYIAAEIVLRTLHFNLSPGQTRELILWGMFFGFAPDLDFFLAFAKIGKLRIDNSKTNHRRFLSHVPWFWLIAGVCLYAFGNSDFSRALGILLWLCSWSHFILDSEWGIMWGWPFSKRLLPFSAKFYADKYMTIPVSTDLPFWKYWWKVVISYFSTTQGWIEIVIILIAILYYSFINK